MCGTGSTYVGERCCVQGGHRSMEASHLDDVLVQCLAGTVVTTTMKGVDDPVSLYGALVEPAAEVLGRAFQDDPVFQYLFPEGLQRKKRASGVQRFLLNYGLRYGRAHATSSRLEGVAVWLPSETAYPSVCGALCSGALGAAASLGVGGSRRAMYYGERMTAAHKRLAPFRHWYLQVIGVDPELQGMGHASRLLQWMLARVDQDPAPCYLETQKEDNVLIYQRYGFGVVEEFTVPETPFKNWAMLRSIRQSG